MSAFLGPIHHWLFNKILLFEALETSINEAVAQQFGDSATQIAQSQEQRYGSFIPKQPLESLIDTDNIHGWLQNRIQIAETRQAAVLKEYIQSYGSSVIEIAERAFKQQGHECGLDLQQKHGLLTAPNLYQQLNNYLLEGMPCDHVNNVDISEEAQLQWKTSRCLHKPYWQIAAMDIDIMYQLRSYWIKGFVEAANPAYTYSFKRNEGTEEILHRINKK